MKLTRVGMIGCEHNRLALLDQHAACIPGHLVNVLCRDCGKKFAMVVSATPASAWYEWDEPDGFTVTRKSR